MPVLRAHTQACLFYVPIRRRACSMCPYAGVPVLRALTQACLFYVPIRRRACSTCPYAGVPVLRAHTQACLFYVPRALWLTLEGGLMKHLAKDKQGIVVEVGWPPNHILDPTVLY